MSKLKNRKVKLGIRSEFIKIGENQKENIISVNLDRVEDFGNFKLITAKMDGKVVKSKVDRERSVSKETLNFYFPPDKCCIYEDEKLAKKHVNSTIHHFVVYYSKNITGFLACESTTNVSVVWKTVSG